MRSGRPRLLAAALRPLLGPALPPSLCPALCRVPARGAAAAGPSSTLRVPTAEEAEQLVQRVQGPRGPFRRFIACPKLARRVRRCMQRTVGPKAQPVVVEIAPGPGVLTRTLLKAGMRVVALESNPAFLPDLQSLENSLDGQLKVIYGDFFRMDPLMSGQLKPPAMSSETLFETMGVAAVPWRADVPVKIFGIVGQTQRNERNRLWRLLFSLYECASIYKYGRLELNIFISEKEYKVLTGKPGDAKAYKALSVLSQVACEIELLHKEPWSSFLTNMKSGGLAIPKSKWLPNDHLCLVQLTPRKNLFTESLTPTNSATFIFMVKQCFGKPSCKLIDRLNSWTLDGGEKLLKRLKISRTAEIRNLYPEDFVHLFEALQNSAEFSEMWFYDETLESVENLNL